MEPAAADISAIVKPLFEALASQLQFYLEKGMLRMLKSCVNFFNSRFLMELITCSDSTKLEYI